MDEPRPTGHLSQLSTHWSLVFQANQEGGSEVAAAQAALMGRYAGAVYLFVRGFLQDENTAWDLCQEFAVKFIRGDFHRAQPERGRFRDLVKAALRNLVRDHFRRLQKQPITLPDGTSWHPADETDDKPWEAAFRPVWRDQLFDRAWEALAAWERTTGSLYHAALRWRVEHPEAALVELTKVLAPHKGKPVEAENARQLLHRARTKFADLLLEEVAGTLNAPTPDKLAEELADLDLLRYCGPALERWTPSRTPSEPEA